MSKTVDLGPVSAYALAVKHGYTGTEAEWVAEMESKRLEAVEAASNAQSAATAASQSKTASANSATASANSATASANSASAASGSATEAESYARGGTGSRAGEDTDNAKYYYEKAKNTEIGNVSEAVAGLSNDVGVLSARLDNIASLPEGSTTADAELMDIRVGSDGRTYNTAGEAVREQVGELKSDLAHLFFETEKSSKVVNAGSLNFLNTNYSYEIGKRYLIELKCEKTQGKIYLSTADINFNLVEEDFAVLTEDLTSVLVDFTPNATFTKWQIFPSPDVDNTNVTLNVYEYGGIQNLTNERLSNIDYSIDKINRELGCIEKTVTCNLDTNKGNVTFVNLSLKKDRLYHFNVTGNFTSGKLLFSTRQDINTILEENFKVLSSGEKDFYFVPKYDSNVLTTYTANSYVGDNPLSMSVDEINLLSLNITFLSTLDRLKVKEDCVVYDYDEKNLYIHKNGEWFKVYTEKPSFSSEYEIGTNPVINKLPSDVSQLADPTVIRFNNAFYLFDTGDRIPIFKSFDMVNWEFYGYMMSEQDFNNVKTLTDNFLGTWAPDVIKIGNKWVCYVSLADRDYINKCKVIAFTADRPDEEWTYSNVVVDNPNNNVKECIDPDVIIDNGIPYMFVGSFYNIYLFKLSEDGLTVDTSYTPKIIAKAGVVEGSYIYKKDGYYYLFLSNGTSDKGGNYKLKVARAETLDGIYYNKDGVAISNDGSLATTILESNGVDTFSVGHNGDIFIDRNGKYFIPFHGYTDKTTTRRLFIQEILWGEDGFPYFENEQCSLDFKIPKF